MDEFRGVYNYVDRNGDQQQVRIDELKDSIEIDKMNAQAAIMETQATHNHSLCIQTNIQTFILVLTEIRQALGSFGIDDEKESMKENSGPTIAIKSAFEAENERARLKKLYGRTIDGAVRCVCQLDPSSPPSKNDLMFDNEL